MENNSDTISTDEKSSKPWQFKPGNNANPVGRPKGSRNKLGEDFVADLHADFLKHGKAAIVATRDAHPEVYLKVIAAVIPKEMTLTVEYEGMSESDLDRLIEQKLAQVAWSQTKQSQNLSSPNVN